LKDGQRPTEGGTTQSCLVKVRDKKKCLRWKSRARKGGRDRVKKRVAGNQMREEIAHLKWDRLGNPGKRSLKGKNRKE